VHLRIRSRIEEQIEEAIERGDWEAAALFAAKIANPAGYLAAMTIVNDAMKRQGSNMFKLKDQAATLIKFTPYTEMHGTDPVPGSALRLQFNVASAMLAGFHDELRAFFFHKHGARQHDLADATADAPDLRFEKFKLPLLWRQAYDESLLTVHIGDRIDTAIILPGRVKKPFAFSPMQGGTVVVGMTYHCHPQDDDVNPLYKFQKREIRISFDPGKEVEAPKEEDDPPPGGEDA